MKNNILSNLILCIFVYLITLIYGSLMPFLLVIMILLVSFFSKILALRLGILILTFLITNQFLIQQISQEFGLFTNGSTYVSGIIYYCIILLIVGIFGRFYINKYIILFTIPLFYSILNSVNNLNDSIVFLLNVIGGFLSLYYIANYSINNNNQILNKKKFKYFSILKQDFLGLVIFIATISWVFLIFDYISNLSLFKYSSQAIITLRGEGEGTINGIPRQFWTSILNFDSILRYSPFISDPIRSAYWNMYLFLYTLFYYNRRNGRNSSGNILYVFLLLTFFILFIINWSKGVYLSFTMIIVLYFFLKRKLFKVAISVLCIFTAINIYLSSILKTSGIIHVAGLIGPFKQPINLNYFVGNNLYQAGNMGRMQEETWDISVLRGAESLVGTYMYAFGVIGVTLFIIMHFSLIKKFYEKKNYLITSILMVGLSISFLQEGQYNIFQSYILILIIFLSTSDNKNGLYA